MGDGVCSVGGGGKTVWTAAELTNRKREVGAKVTGLATGLVRSSAPLYYSTDLITPEDFTVTYAASSSPAPAHTNQLPPHGQRQPVATTDYS